MKLRLLALAAALMLGAGQAAAVPPDPAKIRATFERLCTGDAPASVETCAALRRDMEDAGTPGTVGYSGLGIGPSDDGVKAAYIYYVAPGSPAAAAGLRTGDRVFAVDGEPVVDGKGVAAVMDHEGVGRRVSVKFMRGASVSEAEIKLGDQPALKPIYNAQRTSRGSYSIIDGAAVTVDKVQVGETLLGIIEDSDASHDWGWREDCVEIVGGAGRPLAAIVTPNGSDMNVYVQPDCDWGTSTITWAQFTDGKKPGEIAFESGGQRVYLLLSGHSTGTPYRVTIRDLTPTETANLHERNRRNAIEAEQRRQQEQREEAQRSADRSALFGAIVSGVVAGVTNTPIPAMRADGSAPNPLETLNAANAVLQQRNAESAARLNATIAYAQEQGRLQAQQKAQAEQQAAQARAQAQAQRVAQDRQAATVAFGNARSQIEGKLREAAASGDAQQQAYWQGKLKENDGLANQYGVGAEVRQYAQSTPGGGATPGSVRTTGQGKLGQTPLGGFPAPVTAPNGKPPMQVAQAGGQPGSARLPSCISRNPDECLVKPQDKSRSGSGTDGRTGGGSGSGRGGGGATGGPGTGSGAPGALPGGRPPGGGTLPGQPRPPGVGDDGSVIWQEGVVLCEPPKGNSKEQRCTGPLQFTYANFQRPNWGPQLALACGGNHTPRDLGMVDGYRAFGCGYAVSPTAKVIGVDVARLFGVSYVPGRISYRCNKEGKNCRPS